MRKIPQIFKSKVAPFRNVSGYFSWTIRLCLWLPIYAEEFVAGQAADGRKTFWERQEKEVGVRYRYVPQGKILGSNYCRISCVALVMIMRFIYWISHHRLLNVLHSTALIMLREHGALVREIITFARSN